MNQEQEQRLHEMLCAYVLGECDANERAEIERELARSPELRAERAKIEKTIAIVRDSMEPAETLSPAASAALVAATNAPRAFERPNPWMSVPWLRIAAGIGAVTLGWVIFRESNSTMRVGDLHRESFVARLEDADKRRSLRELGYAGEGDAKSKKAEPAPAASAGAPARAPILVDATELSELGSTAIGVGSAHGEEREAAPKQWISTMMKAEPIHEQAEIVPFEEDLYVPAVQSKDSVTAVPPAAAAPAPTDAEKSKASSFSTRRLGGLDRVSRNSVASTSGGGPTSPGPSGPATGGPLSGLGSSTPHYTWRDTSQVVVGKDAKSGDEKLGRLEGLGYTTGDHDDFFVGRMAKRSSNRPSGGLALELEAEEQQLYYWQLPVAEQQVYLDTECRRVLSWCTPRPNERPRDMFFRFWGDNPFEVTALDALSTFSADVDTASYALARRYLNEGQLPEKAQIRTEEFVNYFKGDVPPPTKGTFAIHTDLTPSRFSTDTSRQMLRVVVRGKEIPKEARKPLVLTFVIDVSGSMREQNRLEMVKHSIRLLVSQLSANDRIAIIKFSNDASRVLPMISAGERAKIEEALQPMQPEGSTNSESGLKLGYAEALAALDPNAVNRVVFLSDGVANVGETDPVKLSDTVKPIREKGILLNTIGVGMNNHNDVFLEQLADKGDGLCNYIDSPDEAKRALVDNFTSALHPIARQVKIQVEFDPAQVLRYRLLGYENRAIADADFRNDKIDAGEVGSGHQVTALYELERIGGVGALGAAESEKPLATVRLRWKAPKVPGAASDDDPATEIAQPVLASQLKTFEGAGQGYRRAAIVAQFAEILRRSIHARGHSLDDLLVESAKLQREMPEDKDFKEFVDLVSKSKDLILRNMPACDDLCQAIDAVREHQYRLSQLEQFQKERDQKLLDDLKKQNDELEARLRELVRRKLETQGK